MKKTEPKKSRQKEKSNSMNGSLKDVLLQIANTFFHNAVEKIQEGMKAKLNEFLMEIKKFVAVSFLVVVGALFVFIGMASLVDHLAGIRGVGFMFIGFLLAMMGVFFNIIGKGGK